MTPVAEVCPHEVKCAIRSVDAQDLVGAVGRTVNAAVTRTHSGPPLALAGAEVWAWQGRHSLQSRLNVQHLRAAPRWAEDAAVLRDRCRPPFHAPLAEVRPYEGQGARAGADAQDLRCVARRAVDVAVQTHDGGPPFGRACAKVGFEQLHARCPGVYAQNLGRIPREAVDDTVRCQQCRPPLFLTWTEVGAHQASGAALGVDAQDPFPASALALALAFFSPLLSLLSANYSHCRHCSPTARTAHHCYHCSPLLSLLFAALILVLLLWCSPALLKHTYMSLMSLRAQGPTKALPPQSSAQSRQTSF